MVLDMMLDWSPPVEETGNTHTVTQAGPLPNEGCPDAESSLWDALRSQDRFLSSDWREGNFEPGISISSAVTLASTSFSQLEAYLSDNDDDGMEDEMRHLEQKEDALRYSLEGLDLAVWGLHGDVEGHLMGSSSQAQPMSGGGDKEGDMQMNRRMCEMDGAREKVDQISCDTGNSEERGAGGPLEHSHDPVKENPEQQQFLEPVCPALGSDDNDETFKCFEECKELLRMPRSKGDEQSECEVMKRVLKITESVHGQKKLVDDIINCCEQRVSEMRKRLGREHAGVAAVLHVLGKVLVKLGDYERAVVNFEHAVEIKKNLFGSDHNEVALTLNCLGGSLCKLKKFEAAVEVCTEALRISRVEPLDHAQETMALNMLGLISKNRSNYQKSIEYYEEALRVQKLTAGSDARPTGITLRNLGGAHHLKGNLDKAILCYTEALSMREAARGKETDLLGTLGKLHKEKAVVCESIAERKDALHKAIQLFEEAYARQSKDYGKNQSSIFSTLSSLGEAHALLGLHVQSLSFYESALKTLKIAKGGFKTNPGAFIATLSQMGSLYLELNDPDAALLCFQKALNVCRVNPAIDGEMYLHCFLRKRGDAFMMKMNYDNARKDYEEAFIHVPKDAHEERLEIQRGIATVFQKSGGIEGAIERYDEILRERKQLRRSLFVGNEESRKLDQYVKPARISRRHKTTS